MADTNAFLFEAQALREKVALLQSEVGDLNEENERLLDKVAKLEEENKELRTNIIIDDNTIADLKHKLKELEEENTSHRNSKNIVLCSHCQNELNIRRGEVIKDLERKLTLLRAVRDAAAIAVNVWFAGDMPNPEYPAMDDLNIAIKAAEGI